MDTSITVALIGIFGTCAIGGFGFIFTTLRAGMRDNGTRIGRTEERFGGLEVSFGRLDERTIRMEERAVRFEERTISEFGQIKDVLARIEATQEHHGRQLADHGRQLEDHGRLLADHARLLETHSHQLADHGRLLEKLAGGDAPDGKRA